MLRAVLLSTFVALSVQLPLPEEVPVPSQHEVVPYNASNPVVVYKEVPVVDNSEPIHYHIGPSAAEKEQNENAHYEFSVNVQDHISDLSQTRSEVRDGTTVTGSYSYSDGYNRRTVHYIADENGFRILKEEVVPLNAEGPKVDLNGIATVNQNVQGRALQYSVQSVPQPGPVAKIVKE